MTVDVVVESLVCDADDEAGAFDALMDAVQTKLDEQFALSRITGPDYASVYLGSIQSAMAQAVAFTLGARTANAQAALLEQQELTEVQNTLKATEEVTLVENQANLVLGQIAQVTAETALTTQKTLTEIQETSRVAAQTDVLLAEEALLDQRLLTEVQTTAIATQTVLKTVSETALLDAKTITEGQVYLTEVATTASVIANTSKIGAEEVLLDNKALTEVQTTLKVAAETGLLTQKTATELAQIENTVLATGQPVEGIVAEQKDLYAAQTAGFARDAEQKLLKISTDLWAVNMSVNNDGMPANYDATDINEILNIAKAGITTP